MKELSASLKEFSEKNELLRLAYTDAQGYPRVVPVWYVVVDGAYCLGSYLASAKYKAITRDARVGWVIDGGEAPKYKGISLYGRAVEVSDTEERARIYAALGAKYF